MATDRRMNDPVGSWSFTEGMETILKKSCKLMAKRGFHGTSMRDLAHETGRSLSGLYHHFRSKEDLLFLINHCGFTTLNESWQKLSTTLGEPRERLYAFVFFHMSYFAENMDEMRVMTWGTQVLNLEKARMIQKLKDRYTRAARQVIDDLHKSGNGGEPNARRLERETYLLFGMMNWTFTWYSERKHGPVAELIRDVYRTFLTGISMDEYDDTDVGRMEAEVGELFRANKTPSMWASPEAE